MAPVDGRCNDNVLADSFMNIPSGKSQHRASVKPPPVLLTLLIMPGFAVWSIPLRISMFEIYAV